ncbi:hypothetical protein [Streptomyces sp. S186]|uniref:hypothetical protein n=1 Tax=Streptomyces sp. S186 TaxID=3434395 RepID=UPI003F67A274
MKVYERTENGTTAHVSISEAMAEVHDATIGRLSRERSVRKMSSSRTEHHIEYADNRVVHMTLVDEPATVEAGSDGRRIVTFKGKRYVVGEITPGAFITYWSGGPLGLPSGPTRTATASMKPGTVGRAIWDAVNR